MTPWTYRDALDALAARGLGQGAIAVTTAATTNPTPDRRSKIWTKWPTIPAGTRFRLEPGAPKRLGTLTVPSAALVVIVPCGIDWRRQMVLAQPLDVVSPLFAALLPNLTPATPTLDEILTNVAPQVVLARLLDQGRLTLADVSIAVASIQKET